MKEPPNRADLAKIERYARRILIKSRDQDIRKMCKWFLEFASQLDQYVEGLYPGFSILENEIRQNGCLLLLESDGVWRIRNPDGKVITSGKTIKDLHVNLILWDRQWVDEEDFDDDSKAEDEIFEPDRRKSPRSGV